MLLVYLDDYDNSVDDYDISVDDYDNSVAVWIATGIHACMDMSSCTQLCMVIQSVCGGPCNLDQHHRGISTVSAFDSLMLLCANFIVISLVCM